MSAQPTPAAHNNAPAQRYRDMLDGLLDMGMDLARRIHARAKAQDDAAPPDSDAQPLGAAAIAFDRVSRAIRRTIALARSLDHPAHPAQNRAFARRRILREVEDAIHRSEREPTRNACRPN